MSQGHATGNEKVASSRVAGRIILSCGGRRSAVYLQRRLTVPSGDDTENENRGRTW